MKETHRLSDVFGLSRKLPKTYTMRDGVDDLFVESLGSDKHVVVHGSSKQGKTCLRKQHLSDDECIVVQCTRDVSKPKLYEAILKSAGVSLEVGSVKRESRVSKVSGDGEVDGGVPLFAKAKARFRTSRTQSRDDALEYKELEIDLSDPNDITRVLERAGVNRYLVIEDFHYLSEAIQQSFAFDLKVFHEKSDLVFVIVGVWLEKNRLVQFNGDLSQRLTPVDADRWDGRSLRNLIRAGEVLLNIRFSDSVVDHIVRNCEGNVGIAQQICEHLCKGAKVFRTQVTTRLIDEVREVDEAYRALAEEQAVRYINFLG
ncbi:MAG: hypothetical protein MPN21_27935, partial [Thermoanaerobaculia bacterium]|nr:hypothetical protein [Thermoanaerobaculia bacterium]